MLDVLGLQAGAEAVYELLLTGRPATVSHLTAATGMTAQRVRGALRALETCGLVTRTPEAPECYAATDPGIALDVLLLKREEELKRARVRIRELTDRFHEAIARNNSAKLVEIVTGRDAIVQRIVNAQRGARRELRSLDKPPYVDLAGPTGNDREIDFLRRGGTLRVIYEQASIEMPGRLTGDISQGIMNGSQDRVLPELPTKLILVDDRFAIVPLQAAPSAIESAVTVHRSALLETISALFEALWRIALPLELATADPGLPEQPTTEERQILALLTTGLPDDAIARQLGLSDRTYQRRIRKLMERLHARTRFQLARQAARRGWLQDDC